MKRQNGIMKKIVFWIVAVLSLGCIASLIVYFGLLFMVHDFDPNFLNIDSCLDSGGCWDYVDGICRKGEPNAQELCNRQRNG